MPHASEIDLLVLHELRLKGFAEVDDVVRSLSIPDADVRERLAKFEQVRHVRHLDGGVAGWTLTSAGRAADERMLADEIDSIAARDDVARAFRTFTNLNQSMLDTVTRWQMRGIGSTAVVNDHSDTEYDMQVVAELESLDEAVQPVCRLLAGHLGRFGSYGPRFTRALDLVKAGRLDWFAKPGIDSYHTVWFELHEDLLATLGVQRGQNPVTDTSPAPDSTTETHQGIR